MIRKTFVLDTNVLLYDPTSIKKFQNNDVVIPLIVLEELDALKRRTDELGKNARAVVRYIDSLKTKKNGDLTAGIIIDEGPKIKIHLDLKSRVIKNFPLPLDRNSNKILYISRSEEHTSELQSHSFISYAVFCLKKKKGRDIHYE